MPTEKVIARFARAINTAVKARAMVDEMWIYDNSYRNLDPSLLGLLVHGKVEYQAARIAAWALPLFETDEPKTQP